LESEVLSARSYINARNSNLVDALRNSREAMYELLEIKKKAGGSLETGQ
jgi:hypothetical protein